MHVMNNYTINLYLLLLYPLNTIDIGNISFQGQIASSDHL